jgi:hypothetical protein
MKNIFYFLVSVFILSGCATKMAYLNTQKTPEDLKKDKAYCQSLVDASDIKDSGLKQKKFDQCMKEAGYDVVSEDKAEKVQGLKGLWIKQGTDFKAYEAIFIEKVDLSQAKVGNTGVPDLKVSDADINNLGVEMLKRFSKALNDVMPVIEDKENAAKKKTLYLCLKLESIYHTNVGLNATLGVAGQFSPVPLPGGPEGTFSFEGAIEDLSSGDRLIAVSDVVKSTKNASLVGSEKFSNWQQAYNVMDYWADKLAALIAKERGQQYKSKLGIKIF